MFRANYQDRDEAIESLGEEAFYSIEGNERFRDIPPPECFKWIYGVFIELRDMSGEVITFQDIDCWQRVRKCVLSQYEIGLVRQMQNWAGDEIQKLREASENG